MKKKKNSWFHSQLKQLKSESRSVVSDSLWPRGLYSHWNSPGQNAGYWVAFPFSRSSSLLRDQTQVSHIAGGFFTSWAIREVQEHWSVLVKASSEAYPFSSQTSWPRNWTRVSCIADGFFTNWAIREELLFLETIIKVRWAAKVVCVLSILLLGLFQRCLPGLRCNKIKNFYLFKEDILL